MLIPPVAQRAVRATLLNLMVDALLDFRAIAFLTSIPLLTTTLVSTCLPTPPCPIPYAWRCSRGRLSPTSSRSPLTSRGRGRARKNSPACNSKNAHVSVAPFNRDVHRCGPLDCRIYTHRRVSRLAVGSAGQLEKRRRGRGRNYSAGH